MPSSVSFVNFFRKVDQAIAIETAEGLRNSSLPQAERLNKNPPSRAKVLVIDMDGTLLRADHTPPPQATEVFREVRGAGVRIILASARPPRSVLRIQDQLKLDGPIVALNGAWMGSKDGEMLERPLALGDPRFVLEIAARCEELGIVINLYTKDSWITSNRNHPLVHHEIAALGYQPDAEIFELAGAMNNILKISVVGPTEALAMIESSLKNKMAASAFSDPFHLEVTGFFSGEHTRPAFLKDYYYPVSKKEGVRFLLERDGLRLRDALAMGDGENDASILASCGHGVSFVGACEQAIHCADEIITRDREQTILPYLIELFRLSYRA